MGGSPALFAQGRQLDHGDQWKLPGIGTL